jgi:hypothetical protein
MGKSKDMTEEVFVVESYDDDQQQAFTDIVVAKDADAAEVKVANLRTYAVVSRATSMKDEIDRLEQLRSMTPQDAKAEWDVLVADLGKVECRKCGLFYDASEDECSCGEPNPEGAEAEEDE